MSPAWFAPVEAALTAATSWGLSRHSPPPHVNPRRSAVLVLFGHDGSGPDVLLTQRASTLRSHAGQVSFPGGTVDETDDGPAAAALREAQEETGLDPDGVRVAGLFPELYLPVSDHAVTPVLAWWQRPTPVSVVDSAEVERVVRVSVRDLIDPTNRFRVAHPSGYVGPGFAVRGLFVWGFTAGVLSEIFTLTGWERPWDTGRVEFAT